MSTPSNRPAKVAKSVFRIVRNMFAILGVAFAYLLWTGYTQYQERLDAGDVSCSLTRCL